MLKKEIRKSGIGKDLMTYLKDNGQSELNTIMKHFESYSKEKRKFLNILSALVRSGQIMKINLGGKVIYKLTKDDKSKRTYNAEEVVDSIIKVIADLRSKLEEKEKQLKEKEKQLNKKDEEIKILNELTEDYDRLKEDNRVLHERVTKLSTQIGASNAKVIRL